MKIDLSGNNENTYQNYWRDYYYRFNSRVDHAKKEQEKHKRTTIIPAVWGKTTVRPVYPLSEDDY